MKKAKGFTLAELLIVVAIIAMLVAISIPIFNKQLEKSRNAVDMNSMRSAKSLLAAGILSGDLEYDTRYYYNGSSLQTTRPEGYGKSRTPVQNWWTGGGYAQGTPYRDQPAALAVFVNEDQEYSYIWDGLYAGMNVKDASEYNTLSKEAKLEKDIVLVDSLQDEFKEMSFADIKAMFYDDKGRRKTGYTFGSIDGKVCVVVSKSLIDSDGKASGVIYTEDVFKNVGYNTSMDKYVINSVQGSENYIWLNIGVSEQKLKGMSEDELKNKASKAYTYVKSSGATTPDELREAKRKVR